MTTSLCRKQASQRRKIVILEEVEQDFAVSEILNAARFPFGGAGSIRLVGPGRSERGKQSDDAERSKPTARHRLLPLRDHKLGLQLSVEVGDAEFDIFRPDALLENNRGSTPIITLVRALARKDRYQLMLPCPHVAQE